MYKLRDYQQDAVDRTKDYFQKTKEPAVIVLPTGAGKSLVIAELAKIARGRVLVLAHVKELVEQNHAKYESYQMTAGIFSAGLNRKDKAHKVIFGSIQSVANAPHDFFSNFNLLIIDECHRVSEDQDSQYQRVISLLKDKNSDLCILGLTATPYRLGIGWIYNRHYEGHIRTEKDLFFKNCIFELPLSYMIKNKFLTPPVKINIPVTSYDFSELTETGRMYSQREINDILNKQRRLTPLIIKNIIDIAETYNRKGVMIFSGSVKHAEEIMSYLPESESRIILGDTEIQERDNLINDFKHQKFKYLVNVSVLTTGFDAPHVDVIAILRPTESVSLYQQIIGRGLRLHPGKEDCFVLDYTGMGHDIYKPEVTEKKPSEDSEAVMVTCPSCGFENLFWGKLSEDGQVLEHYGRKCKGGVVSEDGITVIACGHRFRLKICEKCGAENDITARECCECKHILIDADSKLKQARLSKDHFILKPDSLVLEKKKDKSKNEYLEVRYYDFDAKYLSEVYYLNNSQQFKKFHINFLRSHFKKPELSTAIENIEEVIKYQRLLRLPTFVIARKQDNKYWKVTEKIFSEEFITPGY